MQNAARPFAFTLTPLRISAIYLTVGWLWILISDEIVSKVYGVPATPTFLSMAKGLLFVLATASIIHLLILRYDKERKQAGGALQESEERYRRLTENARDMIYRMSLPDGRYEYVSPASTGLFGYTPEEFYNSPLLIREVMHPDCRDYFEEQWAHLLSGNMPQVYEYQIIHKSGTVRWMHQRNVLVRDADGRPVAIEGAVTDVTGLKKIEDQLRHAQKMESVGNLAGGIAHDFNNILTAIIVFGNVLKRRMREDDPLKFYVEQILDASESAAHLTQSLLAFSRKQIINPKPVNINELIRKTKKLLLSILGEDIELITMFADKSLDVMADPGQIEQVLMNLIANAKDAMPGGGALTIGTGLVELDGEYVRMHGYGIPGKYALISLADTGTGMNEETRERIFEPFYTTKEVGKGTGLGLAIVYGIIKQHNGYIDFHSEPGSGTMFNIYLPLIKTEADETPRAVGLISPDSKGSEIILLAEDDGKVRRSIKDTLEESGYRIIEAVDGKDAVEKFVENRYNIRLVMLDVVMPRKNGKEACDEIIRIEPGAKVIFTSGYTADIIHQKGVLESNINYIPKPISPDKLLRKIREVLDA